MNLIRRYFLVCEDGGLAWDKTYHLVFTLDGQMFVQTVKQYEQPFKTPDMHEIHPSEFDKHSVNGQMLIEHVVNKLKKILPLEPNSGTLFP